MNDNAEHNVDNNGWGSTLFYTTREQFVQWWENKNWPNDRSYMKALKKKWHNTPVDVLYERWKNGIPGTDIPTSKPCWYERRIVRRTRYWVLHRIANVLRYLIYNY